MKFTECDRVFFNGGSFTEPDTGVVVSVEGSIYTSEGEVWVKWDSDGKVLFIDEGAIRLQPNDIKVLNEQQAVTLLLSLGYTISKD